MRAAALSFAMASLVAACGQGGAPRATTDPAGPSTPAASATGQASRAPSSSAPAASPAAGCTSVLTGEGQPPEPIPPADDLVTLEIDGRVDLPEESLFVVSSGEVLWATSPGGKVWRIDAADGTVLATLDLPDLGFARPLVTPDAVWLAEMRSGRLLRLDPDDASVVASVDLEPGDRPMALAATDGGLLVANQTTDTLTWVDTTTMRVADDVDLAAGAPGGGDRAPSSIALDGDTAWVVEHRAHALARVRVADGSVSRTCLGDPAAGQLALAASKLWVAGAGGVVSVVDPRDGEVTERLFLPAVTAGELAVDGDTIWVGGGSHIVGIDAVTGEVEVAAATGELSGEREFPGGVAVAVTPSGLWTTDPASFGLLRFAKGDG